MSQCTIYTKQGGVVFQQAEQPTTMNPVKEKETIVAKHINLTIVRAKLKNSSELPPIPCKDYLFYNAATNLPVLSTTDFTCEKNTRFFLSNYPSFFPSASEYFDYVSLPLGKVYVTFTYPTLETLDSSKGFFSTFRVYSKDIPTLLIDENKFPSDEHRKILKDLLKPMEGKKTPKKHCWIKCYQNQNLYTNHIESYFEYCKEEAMEEEAEEEEEALEEEVAEESVFEGSVEDEVVEEAPEVVTNPSIEEGEEEE